MTQPLDSLGSSGAASGVLFEAKAGLVRRSAEFGLGLAWAVLLLVSLFPPSGNRDLAWFTAPLCALGFAHFVRRAFDARPRFLVDERGVTDRTSLLGGELHIPWADLCRASPSRLNGALELEVLDLTKLATRADWRRRLQILLRRVIGKKTIEVHTTLLGVDGATLAQLIEEELEGFERTQLGLGRHPPSLSRPGKEGGAGELG